MLSRTRDVHGRGSRTGGNTFRLGFNERATPQSTRGSVTAMAGDAFEETMAGVRRRGGATGTHARGGPAGEAPGPAPRVRPVPGHPESDPPPPPDPGPPHH